MKRILPELYYRHRGYFLVAVGLIIVHLGWGFDHLLGSSRHSSAVFSTLLGLLPATGWATIHLFMAAFILFGIYLPKKWFWLARISFCGSLSVFGVAAVSYGWAALHYPQASFEGFFSSLFIVLCSLAALLEPPENPRSERFQ